MNVRRVMSAVVWCGLAFLVVCSPLSAAPSKLSGNFAFLSGTGELYVMRADGSKVTKLDGLRPGARLSISPDGRRVAFGLNGLRIVNLDGSGLTTVPGTNENDRSPDWSPDGRKFAFTHYTGSSYDVQTINLDGTQRSTLTSGTPQYTEEPDWSPDGRQVTFWGGSGGYQVYVVNTDGTGLRSLIADGNLNVHPSWAPDGATIAFNRATPTAGVWDIFTMDTRGGDLRLVREAANMPRWSPDGQRIAFWADSGTTSGFQIYVMAPDGSGIQAANDPALGFEATSPVWGCKSPCNRP